MQATGEGRQIQGDLAGVAKSGAMSQTCRSVYQAVILSFLA